MTCPSCGAVNPPGHRFCGQCATALSLSCPACGASADPGQKFCGQCATPLSPNAVPAATQPTAQIPTQAEAPAAENRPVSVLFVDLVGFTSMSETRDPEDVRELLSGYFDVARTIVGRYGGTIEKFIGDAVMAVWGVPAAHEDDAERAVRAALEIVDAVTTYGAEIRAPELRARAGVVTGAVTAWNAPGEGLVAGDRVNTASRVQSAAPPGEVYVDEATRRSTSSAIAYADAGEHAVKGKAEPLHLWRAERVVAGVGGSARVDGLEARFIGRDADLRLVKELFHASIDRGNARLVSVVGAAGVGKSRLKWEFDKYVDGLADVVRWHNGRCLSYGEGIAYWALAEMVRQRFGIAEEDPNDVVTRRLDEGLQKWIHDPGEREFLRPRLGVLLGIPGPELDREELFAGWRTFFERLADDRPVVLAFEDLHWADTGLLDFIDHLLDWAGEHAIFILTFARPELVERRPAWASGRRNATALYLEPLAETDMALLLDDLVAGLPEEARRRIIDRAEGIPLYAVETVRSLIDRDVVVPHEGVYRLVGEVGDLDVPSTLTSLIASRIDALPPGERSLVQDLSVLGGSFPRAAIASVTGDDGNLDDLLASLVRKEVLTVRTDKLSPDRGQYVFAQTLIRTVAYDMLSKKERKGRHLAVAAHLRATFDNDGEDVAEVIAAHYRDALLASEDDADADEIRSQAVAAYERAGQRASALGAPTTAGQIYRTAAELAGAGDRRLTLLEKALDEAIHSGEHQIAFDLASAVRTEHDAAGHEYDSARLAYRHARALTRLNRTEEAVEILLQALPVLEAAGDSADLARTTGWLASFLTFSGRASEALSYSERSLVLAQALGLPDALCQALIVRGTILNYLDRYEEALIHLEAAVDLARRHELAEQEQSALVNASDLFMVADMPRAAELAEAGVAASRRRGDAYSETIASSNLLYVWLYAGKWDRVDATLAELIGADKERPQAELLHFRAAVLASWRGDGAAATAALAHIDVIRDSESLDDQAGIAAVDAVVANATGRPADALVRARFVLDHMGTGLAVRHEAMRIAWNEAIEAAFALHDAPQAGAITELIGGLAPGFISPYCRAEIQHHRARSAAARGEDATPYFADAEAQFAEIGYPYCLARTRLDHARWLHDEHRADEAARYAEDAATTFAELGATVWYERARALIPVTEPATPASTPAAAPV